MIMASALKTSDVFGISAGILEPSYVDRGDLDSEIQLYLGRDTHIALRGESKCGKSWLRQKNLPEAITIQCRLNKSVNDLYVDALSQLGIKLTVESTSKSGLRGTAEATQEMGNSILAKLGFKQSVSKDNENSEKQQTVGQNVSDLRFIADVIKASGKRLVIEDFHYLASSERKAFAYDLKALWDYKCFVVLIGIWAENNLLLHLNSDLSGRVHELSIYWAEKDMAAVIKKGAVALNIEFTESVIKELISNSFGTVGILQKLVLGTLDDLKIYSVQKALVSIDDKKSVEHAAMNYAEQLNAVYQTFAKRVAKGIRTRTKATGIYAHMMAVLLDAGEGDLLKGLPLGYIFEKAHERQSRIQRGNLKAVLEKLDSLQIDADGRGLIMSYDPHQEEVIVVDKQVLLYRKYATVKWPWEELITSAEDSAQAYDPDDGD